MKEKEKKYNPRHWKLINVYMVIYDICIVIFAYFAGLLLRFDGHYSEIPYEYIHVFKCTIIPYAIICIIVFRQLRLYNSIWRFASFNELSRALVASLITTIIQLVLTSSVCILDKTVDVRRMPLSYLIFGAMLQFVFVIGLRFSYRFVLLLRENRKRFDTDAAKNNVMLIGAGAAGRSILRDLMTSKESDDVVRCIIDDNPNKWTRYIDGVQVVGGRNSILENVEKYHISRIYLAIPSASNEERRDILSICKESGCELKNLPGTYQLANGDVTVSNLKEVAIEDLLGREPIKVNMEEIYNYIQGKVILVTGGGGSIGSELCRQVASHNPKQLIIFDVYENNAYEIEQELKQKYPELNLVVLIGSVRDSRRISYVFKKYKPNIVYHAAAHKHVPLMEGSPHEAVKNNTIGTYKTAYAAAMNNCEKFVLISTDKAVNPTNIMGASKRMCEMVIQTFDKMIKEKRMSQMPNLFSHEKEADFGNDIPADIDIKTEFVAVRFGNVLGSNGSVIPLFKKQIAEGGPITVTHPDIIRYFMTIPEAVSLVMQAGTYAKGGEIFVLDMGAPVKIDDLARNLIKLSGKRPDEDIKIEYIGLRPGEKLYEEKLMAEEGMKTTQNKLIHIGLPIPFDADEFIKQLTELMRVANNDDEDIREYVRKIVTTYQT